MERELRRQQSKLAASGLAVIAFGIWSVVKGIILMLLGEAPVDIRVLMREVDAPVWAFVLVVVLFLIVLNVDLYLRIYVGLSARSEAAGKKKGAAYLVVACIVLTLSILSIIALFRSAYTDTSGDKVVTFVIEVTSLIALLNMIVASVRVKKIRKALGE